MRSLSAWGRLKDDLARQYAFVDPFKTPVELEVWTRVKAKGPYPYKREPLLFDDYLNDIVDGLERCLSYRKEARDLEVAGVRAAVDYDHFIRSRPIEQALEEAALSIDVQLARDSAVAAAIGSIDPKASD